MRVVFIGTSEFGIPALRRILELGHEVPLVVSQPDRPRGRGRKITPTPIKEEALRLGLSVETPEKIAELEPRLREISPDLIVLASYGQIVPKSILEIPRMGPLNIHPSLLPRYRGAAPIQRAIMNGEKKTGVTIMWMNERLDAGDIFLQREVEIKPDETFGELHERLSILSADLLEEALKLIEEGKILRIPQNEEKATYAPPIRKEETLISWEDDAGKIHNLVRALCPKPGASCWISGVRFKLFKTKPGQGTGTPGEILRKDVRTGTLEIACGKGSLFVLEIQPEGKKRMDIASFLRGYGDKI